MVVEKNDGSQVVCVTDANIKCNKIKVFSWPTKKVVYPTYKIGSRKKTFFWWSLAFCCACQLSRSRLTSGIESAKLAKQMIKLVRQELKPQMANGWGHKSPGQLCYLSASNSLLPSSEIHLFCLRRTCHLYPALLLGTNCSHCLVMHLVNICSGR